MAVAEDAVLPRVLVLHRSAQLPSPAIFPSVWCVCVYIYIYIYIYTLYAAIDSWVRMIIDSVHQAWQDQWWLSSAMIQITMESWLYVTSVDSDCCLMRFGSYLSYLFIYLIWLQLSSLWYIKKRKKSLWIRLNTCRRWKQECYHWQFTLK